jgi:hypothetical protein
MISIEAGTRSAGSSMAGSLAPRVPLIKRMCYVVAMGNQTYMKRQKEIARQQKQRDKFARRLQRKAEKTKGGPPLETENPNLPNSLGPQSEK